MCVILASASFISSHEKKIASPVQVLRKEGADRIEHRTAAAILKVANPNRENFPLYSSC